MTADSSSLRQIMLPIRLGIDPMERLLVASFKGDPEFEGFEPQIFDDPVNGRGMRGNLAVGSGIDDFMETTIEPARFEITENNLDLHVAFNDVRGRKVELRIHEDLHGMRGFPLLAPVGADVGKLPRLMLVFMPVIDLVRRTGSLFEGRIGDRILRPASLPILLDWQRVLFIRYAAKPVIGTLNPPMSRPLMIELPEPGRVEVDGMTVSVGGNGSVTCISAGLEPLHVGMDFSPGFPNLLEIPDRRSAAGRWTIHIVGANITGGSYSVSRVGDRVSVELDVTERWKPSGLPLAMELFTRIVPIFRTWPATYRWRGIIELGTEPVMSGTWERKGGS